MFYSDLKEKIFEKASHKFDQCEIYINASSQTSVATYNEEVEEFKVAESGGISFRGIKGNKEGYAYSEDISEGSIEFLIDSAYQIMEASDDKDEIFIYKPDEVDIFERKVERQILEPDEKIKRILSINEEARKVSSEIHQVDSYGSESFSKTYIANTYGLEKYEENQYIVVGSSVIIKKGDDMKTNGEYFIGNSFDEFDFKDLAKQVVEITEKDFGGKPVKSSKYDIVIKNGQFASLLSSLMSGFSAYNVQKKMSPFTDKDLDSVIASDKLSISDNIKLKGLNVVESFDGDGLAKKDYDIIKDGKLISFVHNIETASKDGISSNAGSQRSYKSTSSPGVGAIEVKPGNLGYDEMLEKLENGLVITSIQGLHSGLNAVSGEFSVPVNGYLVENGKEVRAVNQIVMSSSVKELLMNIKEVGSDVKLGGGYRVPSVLIGGVSISGE